MNEEDINNAQPAFQAASVVLLQLEIPLHTVMPAADKAFTLHKKLIINPAPAQGLPESLLQKIYLITPNETEAEILTGIKISGIDAAEQAAAILLDKGVQNVIITMGANGAYFKNKTESFITAAPKVIAVDTTAAGDVFNGAVAVAIAKNKPWKEAVDFACRAAAIAVSRMGAQTSAPYINEL